MLTRNLGVARTRSPTVRFRRAVAVAAEPTEGCSVADPATGDSGSTSDSGRTGGSGRTALTGAGSVGTSGPASVGRAQSCGESTIALLAWPDTIGKILMFIVGIWAILAGIGGIAAGFRMKQVPGSGWGWFLAWGVLAAAFGIALLVSPASGILAILWLVGIWAIMAGVVFIFASFFVRKVGNAIVDSPQV